MRTHILTGLFLVTLAGCANSGASSNAGSVDEQDQYNYHVEFTSYADALNEYAKVMPVIGHDSESAWAASEGQYMCDTLLGFLTENIKRIQEGGELLDKTSE